MVREVVTGKAVVDIEGSLNVPVLRDAGRLDLGGIASAVADPTTRARAGKLTLEDIEGDDLHGQQPGNAKQAVQVTRE